MIPSTINRNNPPANTPVASVVVRQNFNNAANDIEALWNYVGGLITGVSSFNGRTGDVTLNNSDVVSALGYNPSIRNGNLYWISPSNITISLVPYAQYSFTASRLNNLVLSAGSLTMSFAINGIPITGLTNLAVTTVAQNPSSSAPNLLGVSDELTMTISNCAGPSNLKFSMLATM